MTENPYATPAAAPQAQGFREGAGPVQADFSPIEMLKQGKELIADQYWTFFGVAALGMLVGSAAPFGIILGPMLCGIYMCFLKKARGEHVELNLLFKGFDHFKNSFIAMMIMMAAMFAVMIPLGVVFGIIMAAAGPDLAVVGIIVFYLGILVVSVAVGVFTMFAFPLIADRGYAPMDALKTSYRGAMMNLGSMLALVFLNFFISIVLAMFCYFPAFLFMPISFAALTLVYLKIFPDQ